MRQEFFIDMIPPTVTDQEKKLTCKNGIPYFYRPPELKRARAKIEGALWAHMPDEMHTGPVRLVVKWCFKANNNHKNGDYKITRPDTDNLQKMLKDVMTRLKYWTDDALVASEIIEKFWADRPGIYIIIDDL